MRDRNSITSFSKKWWRKLTKSGSVIWDVGSTQTRVMINGNLVFNEPTVVAIRLDSGEVIATGYKAYQLIGATSPLVKVVFPVVEGCVADAQLLKYWLKIVRDKVWPNRYKLPFLLHPAGTILLNPSLGNNDLDLWQEVAGQAGLGRLSQQMAGIALPLHLGISGENLVWGCNLGGDHSYFFLVQDGNLIQASSLAWGGIKLGLALQTWLMQEKECVVSWHEVKKILEEKISLQTIKENSKRISAKYVVKGKHPITQLGCSVTISAEELQNWYLSQLDALLLAIGEFLSSLHTQHSLKAVENGLWLMGGASLTPGLDTWLSQQLGFSVSRVQDPNYCLLKSQYLADQLSKNNQ